MQSCDYSVGTTNTASPAETTTTSSTSTTSTMKPLNSTAYRSTPTKSRAPFQAPTRKPAMTKASIGLMMNRQGKCMAVKDNSEEDGINLVQWYCQAGDKGQQWSWNDLESKDRHICNGYGKCASLPSASPDGNDPSNTTNLVQSEHLDESGQKYRLVDSPFTGFYIIKNDFENCLGVEGNGVDDGLNILVGPCKPREDGQNWQWWYPK